MGDINEVSEKYRKYFNERFSKYGESVKSLWGNLDSQLHRFEILSQIGELKDKNILDVGCGFGGFYDFIVNRKKISIGKYIGIDINSEIVKVGEKRHPKIQLYCSDILNFQANIPIDYSVASGIFFLPDANWEKYLTKVSKKMFSLSKIGIGINLLSVFSPNSGINKESYYADPSKVLKIIMEEVSHKLVLRHDYRDNDFTIYVYK